MVYTLCKVLKTHSFITANKIFLRRYQTLPRDPQCMHIEVPLYKLNCNPQ